MIHLAFGSETIVSRFGLYLRYNSQVCHGETVLNHVNTANAIFPAQVLREVGGFDESYHRVEATDYELCQRLLRRGYTLYACPSAVVYHSNNTTWRTIHRALYRQAYGVAHCRIREYPRRALPFVAENMAKLLWSLVRTVVETPLCILYDILRKRRPVIDACAFAVLERTIKICDLWGRIVGGVVFGFTGHPPVMVGGAWTRDTAEAEPQG
ncbi:MAG: glycosyltransferase family 2 protein [Armatimonadota bacterium]